MDRRRRPAAPTQAFLVEGYWPRLDVDRFTDAGHRLTTSIAGLRREGVEIRYVAGTLVPGDEVAYWVLDGPSAETVKLAFARSGLPVERIVPALELRATRPMRPLGPGRATPARSG